MENSDIIAAVATPPGRGGIGIVRVSGKNLRTLARKVTGSTPKARHASLSKFLDERGLVIDEGIALFFPAPHSYTGEDVLELQGHGGPAVMNLVLSSCLFAGARLAQPGEFTLRAFLNDKLDLAQAESVADIIDAGTSEAARCAMRSLQGEFSAAIHSLVQALTDLRMLVEASLDFPEEEADFLAGLDVRSKLGKIQTQLEQVFTSARQGSILREGVSVVLVGQPNVGKSSLLNQLAGEETAIVTEVPGTTRDAIRQAIEIEGVPLHLVDTAGLRETDDAVEKIGIARTRAAIEKANLVLLLSDSRYGATEVDQAILHSLPAGLPVIHVYNKIDLLSGLPRIFHQEDSPEGAADIYVSAKTGAGIERLRWKLLEVAGWRSSSGGEGLFMARSRHLQALADARKYLENACGLAGGNVQLDLLAEELRLAQRALSSITGEFSADDLLGEIFSRFCIGK
ncbi:tRNA uridine-5-carboxymethylaminomethyl(34) synthesis GTPase MnmE [Nitrosovibrio sp. Nv6]|uniref:tRNA uridine-5-carboxymethylaminomethyl(34) synthesis GTPase MnmE n=1 Tax=Nitrosovibrio sp. Nv6 TaxID=1855340 RepID=UPI0008BEF045|nr:tRNA uridine-5-carboxymethylaminomethyl(34) synthesis GTPase MnmE [Nitrosovibrio sp. Nv6]SEP37935.1 tRNA modification GTPase [Nitrosovibrio sp. Nv6]